MHSRAILTGPRESIALEEGMKTTVPRNERIETSTGGLQIDEIFGSSYQH